MIYINKNIGDCINRRVGADTNIDDVYISVYIDAYININIGPKIGIINNIGNIWYKKLKIILRNIDIYIFCYYNYL